MKKNALFLFLISIHIISCVDVIVSYDEQNDIIIYKQKVYMPKLDKSINQQIILNTNEDHLSEGQFWTYVFIFLTSFAGMMSGLTVGYLSIDDLVMELKMTTGTDEEKRQADLVLPILSKRHWLLATLLLCNAGAMEALPLFLDKLMPEYLAIIVSVSLVLVFGEVLPQAVCTGPDQIKIAAMVAPMTKLLMYICSPVSYPIARALDYLLGEHHKSRFLNNDLKALIELHTINSLQKMHSHEKGEDHNINHQSQDNPNTDENLGLNQEQANLMISAIDMKAKKAIELMIPMKNVFMIDYDEILDKFRFGLVIEKGFSRIPVYSNHDRNDIVGLLRIKQLTGIDFNQNKSLRQLGINLKKPIVISPRLSLLDLLREFKKGKSHMAFITEQVEQLQQKLGLNRSNSIDQTMPDHQGKKNVTILGIITLEDVIEKMINTEILDEDDYERIKRKFTGKKLGKNEKTSKNKITKELTKSLIRDRGDEINSMIAESYKKSILQKTFHNEMEMYNCSSKTKEPFIV